MLEEADVIDGKAEVHVAKVPNTICIRQVACLTDVTLASNAHLQIERPMWHRSLLLIELIGVDFNS